MYDYLASTKDQNGNPLQALGLSFYGQGLASLANGGILKFSLDVANQNSPPQLVPETPGVSITLQTTGSTIWFKRRYRHRIQPAVAARRSATANIPEPLSVLVWSALAGAGLLRARDLRKPAPARS